MAYVSGPGNREWNRKTNQKLAINSFLTFYVLWGVRRN